ncbi:LOW QUALITY PROTEIN: uncharacterized protein EMH_0020780 [Eimeria mitis]|uniref:Uncharacterized protein n=1 Tax=Eimeria mitis TaxID=44415 RepID=U6K9A9_9EIME|nr:LOW QUALITY PROTEIN: uncharacterized protein EMH_0020780 [Eimeria mitis]CDJ34529.1 hypothetical protein, conserved [Eimeria mitis]
MPAYGHNFRSCFGRGFLSSALITLPTEDICEQVEKFQEPSRRGKLGEFSRVSLQSRCPDELKFPGLPACLCRMAQLLVLIITDAVEKLRQSKKALCAGFFEYDDNSASTGGIDPQLLSGTRSKGGKPAFLLPSAGGWGSTGVPRERARLLVIHSRVQAAGGAQGSLGKEPDYWSYTPPSPPSAAHRAFSSCSKYDMQSEYLKAASLSGSGRAGMTGNVDRMLSTSHSSADKKAGPPVSASVRQEEADLNDGREPEEEEQPQDDAEWQEYEGGAEQRDCTDGLAEAVWDKRIPQTSTQYPICSRTPRERCAYTTSDDWAIFALHNQYVRPLRDREWVAGEPCIIRKNSFELPPGAYRYSESTCGIPATAFDRFVFPNPPRQFLMAARGRSSGNVDFAPPSSYFRMGTQRSGTRGRRPQLTQQQLLDLERMLWFDPEPRLERPFRLYADSKTCLKGRLHDIGHIMRSGW